MMMRLVSVVSTLFWAVRAWGPDGHTIVAHIAEKFLTPAVDQVLRADLGNISLTDASDWCDDFDHTPAGAWSEDLHFLDYKGKACKVDLAVDCPKDACNVGAIINYTGQVFDSSLSAERRFFALKFVIHVMGDLHQPLHVGSGDNRGGNLIKIKGCHFSNESANSQSDHETNLHAVWDSALIEQMIDDLQSGKVRQGGPSGPPPVHQWNLVADELEARMAAVWQTNRTDWQSIVAGAARSESKLRDGLTAIADESAALGCSFAYDYADGTEVQSGDSLDVKYYQRSKPVVEEQLAKGGARLAQVLDEALGAARAKATALVV